MILPDRFADLVEIMCNCFPTPNQSNRVRGLYHFFQKEDPRVISEAAEMIAASADRFPSPKEFGFWVKKAREKQASFVQAEECSFCSATGMVSATHRTNGGSYTFRCHCPNAARFTKIEAWTHQKNNDYLLEHTSLHDERTAGLVTTGLIFIEREGIAAVPNNIKVYLARACGKPIEPPRDPHEPRPAPRRVAKVTDP